MYQPGIYYLIIFDLEEVHAATNEDFFLGIKLKEMLYCCLYNSRWKFEEVEEFEHIAQLNSFLNSLVFSLFFLVFFSVTVIEFRIRI